jgi:hypothetical protein
MSDPIADLERRLTTGETMIAATTDPTERERLEMHWLRLLHQYEAAWDAWRAATERRAA